MTPDATEVLDLAALTSWLGARADLAGPLSARPLGGGQSNLSYRLDDGQRSFVLRRPPFGDLLAGAHDVVREYHLIEALQGTAVPLAVPVARCEDASVIAAPFTVVEFVDGITLRTDADVRRLTPNGRRQLVSGFGSTLARLHALPPERSGRPEARGWDFAARQLHVWRRQLRDTPGRALPLMSTLADRLAKSIPSQRRVSVVHGDYRLDNLLVGPDGEVLAVIDWELWTLGDPSADLGMALAYWVDTPFEPAPLGGTPTGGGALGSRHDLLAAYEQGGGVLPSAAALRWFIAFGLWRYAAILEGVYRRNLARAYGEREDDAWRRFEHIVPVLAETAAQVYDSWN